ncbi:MAG: helix-turn-helix domain-containing protein, partial [Acidobacteria bacterium]
MKNKKTLTTNEVAKIFMVSDATVKRWAESGLLKSERTSGGHRRFRVDDVLKFQAKHGIGLKRRHGDDSPFKLARYRNTLRGEDSELLNALLAGCEEEAGTILLSEYLNGKTIEQIFDELVCPVMRRVGELWFEG